MLRRLSDTIGAHAPTHDRPTESSELVSTVRRRRLAATALATTAVLTLGGCGTGFDAQTNQVYQPGVGANQRSDEMDVMHALLVANDDGSATVSAGLVNKSGADQTLSSVTVTTLDDEELTVTGAKMLLPLKDDTLSTLGASSDAGGFLVTEGATTGSYVRVTFTFSDSPPVTVEAPVVARTEEFDKVAGNDPSATPEPVESETAAEEAEGAENTTE